MKRLISVLLVISIVSGLFHLDEVSKVPFLHRHFHEYSKNNPKTSIAAYLLSHYIFDGTESGGNSDHSKLPFKSADGTQQHIGIFIYSHPSGVSFYLNHLLFLFPDMVPGLSGNIKKIFQPPRFV